MRPTSSRPLSASAGQRPGSNLSRGRPVSAGSTSLRPRSAGPGSRPSSSRLGDKPSLQPAAEEERPSRSRERSVGSRDRPRSASSTGSGGARPLRSHATAHRGSSVAAFWKMKQPPTSGLNPDPFADTCASLRKEGGHFVSPFGTQKYRPQQPWESMEITGSGMLRPSDTSHSVSTQQRPVNGLLGASMTSDYCTDPPFYRRIGFGVETVNHEELAASPHRRPHCLSCDHGGKEFKPCNFMSTL